MTYSRRSFLQTGFVGATASLMAFSQYSPLNSSLNSLLGISSADAAAPLQKALLGGTIRRKLGDFEVTALLDGYLDVKEDVIKGADSKTLKSLRQESFIPETGPLSIPVSSYLINTGSKLVLIDAGTANAFGDTLGHLLSSLTRAGYRPKQIDAILITHMHPDHLFGVLDAKGQKVFPNAELIVPENDYKFWHDDSMIKEDTKSFFEGARKASGVYSDRLTKLNDKQEVIPGIRAVSLPGHTPGHTGYMISSGNESLYIVGDVVHFGAFQFAQPKWGVAFDVDGAQAIETRQKVFDQVVADKQFIAGMHLPFPGFGYVKRSGDAYQFVPAEWQYKS